MIEVAVGFVGSFLARKAEGLVQRAAGDLDAAFDRKLGELYDWIKGKITGRPAAERSLRILEKAPHDPDAQALVQGELDTALADDPSARATLAALVEELKKLRPVGVAPRNVRRGRGGRPPSGRQGRGSAAGGQHRHG
ncbi:MAG: hypothetical protein JO352_08255 [Chloroflexi bacterium]|nr:hypothetical protein [Chloroflexota bacterium]